MFRITALVLKFISKLKKSQTDADYFTEAKKYWLKAEQNIHFSKEIDFLKNNPHNKTPPVLVNNLKIAWILKTEQKTLDAVCRSGVRTPELLTSLDIYIKGFNC